MSSYEFTIDLDDVLGEIGYANKRKTTEAIGKYLKEGRHYIEGQVIKTGKPGKPLKKFYLSQEGLNKLKNQYKNRNQLPEEKRIKLNLAEAENGRTDVLCSSGVIDVLTYTEVIEIKYAPSWKQAVGQVLVYQIDYSWLSPRIHLFSSGSVDKSMIEDKCEQLNIRVTWED